MCRSSRIFKIRRNVIEYAGNWTLQEINLGREHDLEREDQTKRSKIFDKVLANGTAGGIAGRDEKSA